MRILVCGSRNWNNPWPIEALMKDLYENEDQEITIVVGGAAGADSIAERYARYYGFQVEVHRPDYASGRGKLAPRDRNEAMLATGVRRVHAFRCIGKSNGTDHMIMIARHAGVEVVVHDPR